jgi:hypothetical protein
MAAVELGNRWPKTEIANTAADSTVSVEKIEGNRVDLIVSVRRQGLVPLPGSVQLVTNYPRGRREFAHA